MLLIRWLFDVCQFLKGPQDCPRSPLLFWFIFTVNWVMGWILSLFESDWITSLLQAIISMLLLILFLWGALILTGKKSRFLQTATTALGCDALFSAFAVLLLGMESLLHNVGGIAALFLIGLMCWQIAVMGHVLRCALSIPFVAGLGLAFAYVISSLRILSGLFPPA